MFCRLCLTEPTFENYLNIFEENGESLAQIIAQHFSFEPRIDDSHKIICKICWEILENFHNFYTRIEDAQKHFKHEIFVKSESTLLTGNDLKSESEKVNPGIKPKITETSSSLFKIKTTVKKLGKTKTIEKNLDETDSKIAKFMKLQCDVCFKELPTFTEIKRHFRAVHNMLGYVKCCDKKFNGRIYLSDHVDTHLDPEQFKCTICHRILSNRCKLRQHMKDVHETAKKFDCDVCQKQMANRNSLAFHKLTHIPVEERAFKCTDCEKTFASEYQMKLHWLHVHDAISSNICYVCGKIMKDLVAFKKHQLEHEGIVEPKAQCEKCGLWLKNISTLRKHIRRQHFYTEKNKDPICNICNKKCRNYEALKSHKYYLHSSRTYPCTVCAKEFKKTITLREHMSTHTGEVLYTCPHCPKTFTSNANLHYHRKRNHRKEWEEKRASKLLPPSNADTTENIGR